jgi:hypothetical protein
MHHKAPKTRREETRENNFMVFRAHFSDIRESTGSPSQQMQFPWCLEDLVVKDWVPPANTLDGVETQLYSVTFDPPNRRPFPLEDTPSSRSIRRDYKKPV